MARNAVIVTCEHGGYRVPRRLEPLFAPGRVLKSHRGWDPGALALARQLAVAVDAPLVAATTSRLVVDLNRSEDNPAVFSEFTRGLDPDVRHELIRRHHTPHRLKVQEAVDELLVDHEAVIHVGVHTFTPRLRGVTRQADVALLYDPARKLESKWCAAWLVLIARALPDARLRKNYPYRGSADGLTTTLRGIFPPECYLGIELEVNQALVASPSWTAVRRALARTLVLQVRDPLVDRAA